MLGWIRLTAAGGRVFLTRPENIAGIEVSRRGAEGIPHRFTVHLFSGGSFDMEGEGKYQQVCDLAGIPRERQHPSAPHAGAA